MSDQLSLPEQIVLLHLDDESGKFMGSYFNACLILSAIGELSLRGIVRIDNDSISIRERSTTEDEGMDMVLRMMERISSVSALDSLARSTELAQVLRQNVLDRLIKRGLLRAEQESFLWLWKRTVYPTVDASPEIQLRRHIRDVALGDADPSPQMLILFALLKSSAALYVALPNREIKANQQMINGLTNSSPLGEQLGKVVARIISEDETVVTIAAMTASASTT